MTYKQYRATTFFSSLDGLRCLSIIAVVWHHAAGQDARFPLLRQGYMGVTLFFAISGFLITTLLLRERDSYGTISLSNFYKRRIFRIFPLYYTVILIYIVLVAVLDRNGPSGQGFFANLPYFLTYTSNWFVGLREDRVIFYFAWSLATEEQFYLAWPSIERLAGVWPVLGASTLILLNLTVASTTVTQWLSAEGLIHKILMSISTPICLGVLLAHLLHDHRGYHWASSWLGRHSASLLILVLLVIALATVNHAGRWGMLSTEMLMALLVGSCVIREDHALAKFLTLRPIAWIGVVSYGIYLLHMLVLNGVRRFLDHIGLNSPVTCFVLGLAIVIALASVSYRYYESFFLRLKQRFEIKLPPTDGTAGRNITA